MKSYKKTVPPEKVETVKLLEITNTHPATFKGRRKTAGECEITVL